jgi:large subunit ribosomal protein L13
MLLFLRVLIGLFMKTIMSTKKQTESKWLLVDASNQILGRLACEIARRLRGKHKVCYTPHEAVGDHVIVINASEIKVTGKKAQNKMYYHHTGYMGGLKAESFEKLHKRKSSAIIEQAVKGMLPKGPLGREMFSRLKVYSGNTHPHTAQTPEKF